MTQFIRYCRFIAIVTILAGCAAGEPSDDEMPKLLQAHLRQVQSLEADAPLADAEIEKFRAMIEAKRRAWSDRIDGTVDVDGLLQGIPAPVRFKAAEVADDESAVHAALREGPELEFVVALAALRNPQAAVARQNWRAAVRRFEQASYLEDLVGRYRAFARELDTLVGPQTHKEMPGKTFAFPSVLALKGQAVDLEVEIAGLEYFQAMRKAANEAAKTWFEIQYLEDAARIVVENRQLFAQMELIARELLKVNRTGQSDVLKAQSQLAVLDNRIVTLRRERANSIARIDAVMGLTSGSDWGPFAAGDAPEQLPPADEWLRQALDRKHELLSAERQVDLMRVMVRLAETMVYPRGSAGASLVAPSLGAEAGPTRSPAAAFPDFPMVGPDAAGFGPNAAYIDELRVRIRQAEKSRDAVRTEVEFAVKDARFRTDQSARDLLTYADSVVPKARQSLESTRERYTTGNVPFIEFLDAGRMYLEAVLMKAESRRDRNRAATDLRDAVGRIGIGRD